MNTKRFLGIGLFALVLTGCNNTPSFQVEGAVTGADKETLYFEHSGLDGIVILDSVKLNEKGNFDFEAKRPESPEFYRLRIGNKVIHFAIDSTETVNIHADYPNFSLGYTVTGNENNEKIKELVTLQSKLQQQVNELGKINLPIGVIRDSVATMIANYKENIKHKYIFKAPNKAYSYFALYQELNGFLLFDPLTNREDNKAFAAVATSLNQAYPHADRSRNLYNTVIRGMRNTHKPQTKEIQIPEDKIQEASIIDIPLRDIKGKVRHLTELKDKVVLLDFTVYAGERSAEHNLMLRDLYTKYAAQGFEIYQVSFDTDEHFWKTAADPLPWICVREPQGLYSHFISLYGIQQLPTMYLLNRQNEISLRIDTQTDIKASIQKLL